MPRHWMARLGLVLGAISAVALFHTALFGLQWAHTRRQWSNEGSGFLWVGAGMAVASVASLAAVSLLLRSRRYVLLRWQRILSRTAGALTGLVLASWGFALWVESLGDTCFRC